MRKMLKTLVAMHLSTGLALLFSAVVLGDCLITWIVAGLWGFMNWAGLLLLYPLVRSLPPFEENFIPDTFGEGGKPVLIAILVMTPTFLAFCFNTLLIYGVRRAKGVKD